MRRVGRTSVLTSEREESGADERSMSRDELAQSIPCEEEEGEANSFKCFAMQPTTNRVPSSFT